MTKTEWKRAWRAHRNAEHYGYHAQNAQRHHRCREEELGGDCMHFEFDYCWCNDTAPALTRTQRYLLETYLLEDDTA